MAIDIDFMKHHYQIFDGVMPEFVECQPLDFLDPGSIIDLSWMLICLCASSVPLGLPLGTEVGVMIMKLKYISIVHEI